ncbi:MAG: peptide ABC transporter substrate-binding protein [Verrucomicrobia bacterium]|nr:peptide ABC transporter substrate-binding protein [Verrucomicrobiota bacterium]
MSQHDPKVTLRQIANHARRRVWLFSGKSMTRLFFSALTFCWLIAACAPSEHGSDFVFLNGTEPESLDPAIITGQPEGRIVLALFEGLTARDPQGRVVPGAAERWKISSDGKRYTFHLRADARWSNGEPIVASDFVHSWQRTLSPATASEYAYQLYYVQNAEAYNAGKLKDFSQVGVRALDSRTLEVCLANPTPFFLDLCAFPTLMPVHLLSVEKHGDDWIKPGRMVSNGAYVLEEWRINHRVRLRANPHYWDRAHVSLQTVDILPTSQANTAFNLYHSGAADLILDKGLVPPMLLDALKDRPDFHASPFLGNYFYRFNVTRKPFSDVRVRKAFALAIHKQRLVDKVTRAGEQIAGSLVPPGIPGYSSPPGLSHDPDAARDLLAQAGFPSGKGFPNVSLLYNKSEQNEAIAVEIQDMLQKELGVHVQLAQQEWKVYLNSMSALDYDFCRSSWVGDYNDPNTFLDMFVTNGGNNRTGWTNAKYDTLIRAAAEELDPKRRADIFRQAETLLCREELPILPLYYYVGIQFYDAQKISGLQSNVLDEHPLKYVRKK